jgi:hypothetical protein
MLDNKFQLNLRLSIQVEDYKFKALYLPRRINKISKSYTARIGSVRQQTLAQYQALNSS